MPFSPINVNTKSFTQSGEGRYVLSTVSFGQPSNHFSVRGALPTKDRNKVVAVVARHLEKDVTVNGVTSRLNASVQVTITVPTVGFTAADIDTMLSDISEFVSTDTTNRLLNGES